jgi:uncharacterized membrane protein
MAHAESSITIDQPVNTVFDFIMDGTNNLHWRPAVIDIQRVPGKPADTGAVFKQGLNGPGGRRIEGDYEIVESRPNELIRFQVIAGPARPTGVYKLEKVGNNATRVTFTLDFKPRGLALLMGPMIQKTMQAEVATLSNLKKHLESQHS